MSWLPPNVQRHSVIITRSSSRPMLLAAQPEPPSSMLLLLRLHRHVHRRLLFRLLLHPRHRWPTPRTSVGPAVNSMAQAGPNLLPLQRYLNFKLPISVYVMSCLLLLISITIARVLACNGRFPPFPPRPSPSAGMSAQRNGTERNLVQLRDVPSPLLLLLLLLLIRIYEYFKILLRSTFNLWQIWKENKSIKRKSSVHYDYDRYLVPSNRQITSHGRTVTHLFRRRFYRAVRRPIRSPTRDLIVIV